MKKITTAALLAGAALTFACFGAAAQGKATPRIDQRQANQERRIDQGLASGQLTQREARRLERQQVRIDNVENHAKADGTVTVAERRQLTRMQDRTTRHIARQKHDAQQRPGAGS
jgi:hypothetical protein